MVAIALLVVYLVFLAIQWRAVASDDLTWARRSDLFKGLEALAFAAAGALLGTTVQRQVTLKAESQAADARREAAAQKARADANQREAEKGRALHNLALARARREAGVRGLRSADRPAAPAGDLQDLLDLAAQYDRG